jgi:hypothetical protein
LAEADINFGIVLSVTQSQRLFEMRICFGEIALPEAGKTQEVAAGHGRFEHATFDLRFATQTLKTFARTARKRMRTDGGGYRRDHLRALAQRVEVDQKELRIMGSKSVLLRTLVAASGVKTTGFGVPSSVPKWRARPNKTANAYAIEIAL